MRGDAGLAFDYVVVGAGLAGLVAALELAGAGRVALIAKAPPEASNSAHAQGGIAAAIGEDDAPALHAADTEAAGAGLCDEAAVAALVADAPDAIRWLGAHGVHFDHDSSGRPRLGLEAAHSRPRIVHAEGDASGRAVVRALWERVQRAPEIRVLLPYRAGALLVNDHGDVCGVYAVRVTADFTTAANEALVVRARRAVIVASGGAGALYARTTNPPGATGDGIALAWRAGAPVRNMEFVQFHPTVWLRPDGTMFLISEAVRGAGAVLIDEHGLRLPIPHPLGELAPRDVVARAVYAAWQQGHQVFLDAREVRDFARRFPSIWAQLKQAGLDPARQPLPVAPAAHFLMGGVAADLSGQTAIPHLLAIGETACTGVHGGNRLASNSLLECVVGARRAAMAAAALDPVSGPGAADIAQAQDRSLQPLPAEVRRALGSLLWESAGVVREADRLKAAEAQLEAWAEKFPGAGEIDVALLIIRCALARRESRGAHWRADAPQRDAALDGMATEVWPGADASFVPVAARPRFQVATRA